MGAALKRPRTARTMAVALAAVTSVVAVLAAGCAARPPATPPPTTTPDPEVHMEWWAMGDSLFAGYAGEPGAPSYLAGVETFAVAGNTLVEVAIDGIPQPTVRQQIEAAIADHGVPERMLIHAGVADLVGRSIWSFSDPRERYSDEIASLDEWLTSLGVEVRWVTLVPFAFWSLPGVGDQDGLRQWLNTFLRDHLGDRLVDCDSAMVGEDRIWIDHDYVQWFDGVHVSRLGALAHARCISDQLAQQGIDLPVVTTG